MAFYNTQGVQDLFRNEHTHTINLYSFSLNINIKFAAFITDFNDSFKSEWNQQPVFGKMDSIATFKATTRRIDLAFDIPSGNEEEAIKNLFEVDRLIRGLYPVYDEGSYLGTRTILSPPLFRIKFANLINNSSVSLDLLDNANAPEKAGQQTLTAGLLGYLDGFNFKPDLEQGVFIVKNRIYPKLLKASLGFNVIHQHTLGPSSIGGEKVNLLPEFSHNFTDVAETVDALVSEVNVSGSAREADIASRLNGTTATGVSGQLARGKIATAMGKPATSAIPASAATEGKAQPVKEALTVAQAAQAADAALAEVKKALDDGQEALKKEAEATNKQASDLFTRPQQSSYRDRASLSNAQPSRPFATPAEPPRPSATSAEPRRGDGRGGMPLRNE